MKYVAVLLLIFSYGCMPSIYELSKAERREVSIDLFDNRNVRGILNHGDEANLYLLGKISIISGTDTSSILEKDKYSIARSNVKTIHDRNGNDVTPQYICRNLTDRSTSRVAEIQTNLYNAEAVFGFVALVIVTIVALAK